MVQFSWGVMHFASGTCVQNARIGLHCRNTTSSEARNSMPWKTIIVHKTARHTRACVNCSSRQATEMRPVHEAAKPKKAAVKVVVPITSI